MSFKPPFQGGAAVIDTVENGLTLTGTTIELGGPLTKDTIIDGISTHSFTWTDLVNWGATVTTKFDVTRGEYSLFNDAANASVGNSIGHTWASGTETVAQYASGASKSQSMLYNNTVGAETNQVRVNNNGFLNSAVGTGYLSSIAGNATDTELLYTNTTTGDSTNIKATSTDLFINEGTTATGGTGVATNGMVLTLLDKTTGEAKYAAVTAASVPLLRTIYVGKHGNDSNDGGTSASALLTVGAAITAASALTPAVNNEVLIDVLDAAVYTETGLSLPAYTQLDMDNASLTVTSGTGVTMASNTIFTAGTITTSGTANGITAVDGSSTITINTVLHGSSGYALQANGNTALTTVHLDLNTLFVSGTGTGVSLINAVGIACTVYLEVGLVQVSGAGIGIDVASTVGSFIGSIDGLFTFNAGAIGYQTNTGSSDISVYTSSSIAIAGTIANIVSGTSFHISSTGTLTGAITGSGNIYNTSAKEGNNIPSMNTGTTVVPANDEMRFYSASAGQAERITIAALRTEMSAATVVTKTNADTPYASGAFDTVLADAVSGAIVVDLPLHSSGDIITVKKIDASANTITIDGAIGDTIDGAATATLTTQYESLTMVSDGTNWFVI